MNQQREKLWIPKKYLGSPAGHDFRYVALKVNDYSMELLFEEDDIVVIDRADCDLKKIHENSIYAVRKDDLYYIKHLHFEEKSKILQLISASTHFTKEHGFEYINLKEVEENPIIGLEFYKAYLFIILYHNSLLRIIFELLDIYFKLYEIFRREFNNH